MITNAMHDPELDPGPHQWVTDKIWVKSIYKIIVLCQCEFPDFIIVLWSC